MVTSTFLGDYNMKALTIKEPFASLIANNIKKYEFRTWKTNYRGYVLIHAGKSIDKNAILKFKKYNLNYQNGYIIAIAKIVDCIKVDDDFRKVLKKENNYVYSHVIEDNNWNGYAFKLEEIQKIEPIKTNGKLSLWDYDYKV